MIVIASILLTLFLVSILPDASYFYIVWGTIIFFIGIYTLLFIAEIVEDRAMDKKMECCRCHGRCDKCVANKYRILHNLPAPQKNKESQREVYYHHQCHICRVTLVWEQGSDNLEHICQLCAIQRKDRNE